MKMNAVETSRVSDMQEIKDKIVDLLTSDIPKDQILLVYGAACRVADYMISNGVMIQKTGHWVKKHRHCGGFRRYTGYDEFGEQHTITVDERCEYDDLYCSECGKQSADNFLSFCPNCGAMMEGEYS